MLEAKNMRSLSQARSLLGWTSPSYPTSTMPARAAAKDSDAPSAMVAPHSKPQRSRFATRPITRDVDHQAAASTGRVSRPKNFVAFDTKQRLDAPWPV
jgi:hypothetical protein